MNIDWSRIESLADINDPEDKAWLLEMIESLRVDFETKVTQIEEYKQNKNIKDLQSLLHQIKGVSANFGLMDIHYCSADAEIAAKTGNWEKALELAQKIQPLWLQADAEFQKKFN